MAKKKKLVRSTREKSVPKASLWEKQIQQPLIAKQKKTVTIPSWIIPSILIITFLAYIPVLNAGFVSWDDGEYVYENPFFKANDLSSLLAEPMQGNFHPLTMLSLYFNYLISGFDAWSYHLLNVIFHLLNCFLVFRLAMLLSNGKTIVAFVTAILFGIHPVHVESVAWVAERKDVLYTVFFLAALISYFKYAKTNSRKHYLFSVLLFVLSLLSKPSAVIFPLVLFCTDLLLKRELNKKLILEKIPFGILALIMGIVTYYAQHEAGSFGKIHFDLITKVLYGFYGIMMYIIKLFIPANLAVFYPYPPINVRLPAEYYIAPVFFAILAFVFFYSLKRNRVIAFGILFYIINLLLVLQFLPVGSAVIAERYTYIPYMGLFFILGWLIDRSARGKISKASLFISPVVLLFSILTWRQASTWHDSASLWDNAIKNRPTDKAYAVRAMLLRKEKNYTL